MEQLQSHIWLTASSYMGNYLRISSYIRKPFLIYDFSTALLWISLYMRKFWFSFLSVYSTYFPIQEINCPQNTFTLQSAAYSWKEGENKASDCPSFKKIATRMVGIVIIIRTVFLIQNSASSVCQSGNIFCVYNINIPASVLKVPSGQIGSKWEWYHWKVFEKDINRYKFLIFYFRSWIF
jgi:hypothetical protein